MHDYVFLSIKFIKVFNFQNISTHIWKKRKLKNCYLFLCFENKIPLKLLYHTNNRVSKYLKNKRT